MNREASERNRRLVAAKRATALEGLGRQREAAADRRSRGGEARRVRRDASLERQHAGVSRAVRDREVSLLDLIDRLLDGGVVIHGDITLAVADVDLLYVGLRAMVASVETIERELGVSLSASSPSLKSSSLKSSAL
jgi:gas vesicle structural protein